MGPEGGEKTLSSYLPFPQVKYLPRSVRAPSIPSGEIVAEPGIKLIDGETMTVIEGAYDHFRLGDS